MTGILGVCQESSIQSDVVPWEPLSCEIIVTSRDLVLSSHEFVILSHEYKNFSHDFRLNHSCLRATAPARLIRPQCIQKQLPKPVLIEPAGKADIRWSACTSLKVDNSHAICEFTLCFHIHPCLFQLKDSRIDQISYWARVVQCSTGNIPFVRAGIRPAHLSNRCSSWVINHCQLLQLVRFGQCLVCDIQSEHRNGRAACEYDLGRFCICINIKFSCRCPVAICTAAH